MPCAARSPSTLTLITTYALVGSVAVASPSVGSNAAVCYFHSVGEMGSYKCCLCFTRKFRWSEAQPPADVRAAFDAHSEGGTHMTADQFRRFLAEAQRDAAVADVERVMEQPLELRHRQLFHGKHFKSVFTLDDFHHYLFSEELNPPLRSQLCRTLTSPVELIKCLRSIKEYAFSASPYPVIITLEDHLTPDLQAKVAEVYMGDGWRMDFKQTHFDPYSPPDFYTRVGIAGVPADTTMKKTKAIEDNWIPVWDEEFVFPLTVPELAVLRIEVHEYDMSEKDDFAGQNCFPVSELRPGIRAVPLLDRKGMKFKSVKLLMRFEFA
ncbi:hypothetical protein BHM03_00025138 [Ensete ventricosum]|nr:hypothetical protein BHM03_00025138 [Ensete ventricosum]